ncbi:hypothetical protein TcasGA2_TC005350 [Tribolium castaneum]|uniref:Uncharacterized protein n=1 Tax=Tribolium castaneum TaxID=7070 RepID=D6WUU8_TRICA|nr:hypothetical protein TcasGA2_TC005350 [Tribolium castaneum]
MCFILNNCGVPCVADKTLNQFGPTKRAVISGRATGYRPLSASLDAGTTARRIKHTCGHLRGPTHAEPDLDAEPGPKIPKKEMGFCLTD